MTGMALGKRSRIGILGSAESVTKKGHVGGGGGKEQISLRVKRGVKITTTEEETSRMRKGKKPREKGGGNFQIMKERGRRKNPRFAK